MAAPALGTVQLRQVRRGFEASFLFIALALALLPVLIPDGVDGFRIRDIGAASTEHTRPSCNPLLGKCNVGQKISGISYPTIRLRRKFEATNTPLSRTNKIQPLVEQSSEDVEEDEGSFFSGPVHAKTKPDKLASLETADSVKSYLRTSTVAKNSGGYSGPAGNAKLKSSFASSDEDDEGGEDYENGKDDEDEDNDDDGDDENSEDEVDEENVSDSGHDKVDDEASDETDEEEEKEETVNLDDSDDDDDENDDNEQDDEPDDDSEDEDIKSADSAIVRLARIKYGVKNVKPDEASDRRNLKDPITRPADKGATKKSIEIVEEVRETEIAKEKEEGVKSDDKSAHDDHGVSEQSDTDQPEEPEEEVVDTKSVLSSEISRTDEAPNDDDVNGGSDDEEIESGSKLTEEATKPPRKLEKVRHADKTKSMESLRAISLEELAAKVEPSMVKKDIEVPKPSPQPAPKPEVKQPPKSVEKVSKAPVSQEVKKSESKENSKKVASEPKPKPEAKPKKEVISQPKQPEKLKVKPPEAKAVKKSEKPKTKSKKGSEASITLPELNDLLLQVPSFIPNFTAIGDPVCQQHGKIFLRQLRGYKLWALQMLDSSAKIPSGLLRGNLNQLGDFDQCLAVKAHVKVDEKTVKVQGKYCLATIDLQATRNDMKIPVNLMQSRAFLRASMNEPTHFVPRFTTANWALCVPAACSPEDVRSVIEDALSGYNASTGLRFAVGVDPDSCYVKQKPQPYSKETVAVLYFYAMTVCLVLVATLRDYCVTSQGQGSYSERIIMAFSLRRTTTALMQNSDNGGDIRCIHGIRTIATVLLYTAHKLIPIARIPFANRISLTEVANNPLSSILRVSLVYTDSFLLLSGILTAYNMAKDFNQRGEIRWFCRFVTRFIRLTPALLAVVFWYAFVMEHIGSGPQWSSVIKSNAELCKKNAWTNLLYIQNFFSFEEMCATHTHQLALDMQLSLIAPALVFFLYNKPVIGILFTLFLLQVSATVRYLATTNNYLSVVIFHGMTLKHLYKTANLTYALPLHRATPYLFGVALGVLMRYTGKQFRMHKVIVITGWIVATALGLWSLLSPWRLARRDYTYDVEEATYYAVILPICWAASLSWIIFASFTEHGGVVNRFLSNYWLVVFSRLSYSVYLTQFAVFFYNVGTTRYSSDFQLHRSVDFYEVATVIGASVTLTLLLDLPMQEVKNVIMECTDGLTIQAVSTEGKNDEIETEDEKRARVQPSEEGKVPDDVELESSGWDWYNDQVSSRKIESGYRDDEESSEVWAYRKDEIPTWDWIQTPVQKGPRRRTEGAEDLRTERRSQSRQETYGNEYVDSKNQKKANIQQARDEDGFRREGRSQSRASESKRISAKDPDELSWDYRRRDDSTSRASDGKRSSSKDFDSAPREFTRRERSLAKDNDSAASTRRHEEQPAWEYVKRERSASQSGKEGKKAAFEGLDVQSPALRLSTRSLPRASELQRRLSSEREEEASRMEKPIIPRKSPLDEPRVSDEENWEYELRLRRQKLAANLPSEETTGTVSEEEEWNILKRRSSAEGKMALLSDPPKIDNFGAWSISKEPNSDSTSFPHERSESEEENSYNPSRNDYRETRPPLREGYDTQSEEETSWDPSRQQSYTSSQPTSLDEEEGPLNYGFVLKRESKRTSLQNLSRISQEEPEAEDDSGWDFVKEENTESSNLQSSSTGFFKRASIVRSQASEEDPEYLLPERPKLVEQEQEHPFKKAWQMQKSRSEEEGPAGFLVKEKDGKPRSSGAEGRRDNSQTEEGKRKPSTGGQTEDLSYFGGDEAESTSVSYPASNSGDSANLDWVEDDEPSGASGHDETELESTGSEKREVPQYGSEEREQRRHSKESNWEWNQEET